jgi:cytoplasmic tRNA 2-thiolation protein 1
MPKICEYCNKNPAKLRRAKNKKMACLDCFYYHFEEEIHQTIMAEKLFVPGDKIVLGISGGKDSTVMLHTITTLKERYNYPITLQLLAIDEGIKGYRDDSLETVKSNEETYKVPLTILGYKDLFGITMDEVVSLTGVRCSCTYCGVFRRRALDKGLEQLKGTRLYTGHNADDVAETVLMNAMRGDSFRLVNCTESTTGEEHEVKRSKPLIYCYEKEIVLYAHYKKLVYFSTECTYSKDAYRGNLKELMKKLIGLRPQVIIDIIKSAGQLKLKKGIKVPNKMKCETCGNVSSHKMCKACEFVKQLNEMKVQRDLKKKKIEISLNE